MTDLKALIAEARFGGHTAREVAELLDALASAADRCDANSYSEIASISRRGSAAIRRLAEALEEATPPEGWWISAYERQDATCIEYDGVAHWVITDATGTITAPTYATARAAMEALEGEG